MFNFLAFWDMIEIFVTNGNLGADARVGKKSENGAVPVSFPLLANDRYTNRVGEVVEKTKRYSCTVWAGSEAYVNYLATNLKKGTGVSIKGDVGAAYYEQEGKIIPYLTVRIEKIEITRRLATVTEASANAAAPAPADDGSDFEPKGSQGNEPLPF